VGLARTGLLLAALASGCGFNRLPGPGDGGGGCGVAPDGLPTCVQTKARGYEPLGAATDQSVEATLAPAGMKTAVVWEEAAGSSTNGRLRLALVDRLGAVGAPKLLGAGDDPVLVRAQDQLVLFWRLGDALMMQQMDDTGALLNQPRQVLTGTSESFALAWTGSGFGVLLGGANGDPAQIYWLSLSPEGLIQAGPTKLPQAGINSIQPALAWTGCELAAAWTDTRPGTPAVYFARFSEDFTRLGDDQMISKAGLRGSFPTVAAQAAGGVVVCYQELTPPMNQEIVCSRLDAGGAITRREPMTKTSTPSQNPHALAHGLHTWVLWDDYIKSAQVPNVVWNFLDADGAAQLDPATSDPDIAEGGWRAHGLSTPDALYFLQYWGDPVSNAFTAQVVTENCY